MRLAELTHKELIGKEGSCFFVKCWHAKFLAQFSYQIHGDIALIGHHAIDVVFLTVCNNLLLVEDI